MRFPIRRRVDIEMRSLALLLIRVYKLAISPFWPGQCKYFPSCSEYAQEAIVRHGVARGGWLAAKRLARCHPGRTGGYDPVPNPSDSPKTAATPGFRVH